MCTAGLNSDLKSAVSAVETKVNAGGLFVSSTGDGVTTDVVLTFTNGKVTIPKNTEKVTVDVDETSNPKAIIITFNKGKADEKVVTLPKSTTEVGSIIVMQGAAVSVAQMAVDKSIIVRVNPSNALVTDVANWAIDSTGSYASYVNPSKAFSVASVEPIAPGQYKIGIKANFVSTAYEYGLVYSAPSATTGGDPANTTASKSISMTGVAFVNIANSNIVSAQTRATVSDQADVSATILAGYPLNQVKSITYSIETEAHKKYATVAADPNDMSKAVVTPIASAFTAAEINTGTVVAISAVVEDLKGTKTAIAVVDNVTIYTAFPGATTTMTAVAAELIPITDAAGKDRTADLIGTVWNALPAPFTQTNFITDANVTLTVAPVDANDKAVTTLEAASTNPTSVAGTPQLGKLAYNVKDIVLAGSYKIVYKFTDKRDFTASGSATTGTIKKKSFDVVLPVSFTAPTFEVQLQNVDPNKDWTAFVYPVATTKALSDTGIQIGATGDAFLASFTTANGYALKCTNTGNPAYTAALTVAGKQQFTTGSATSGWTKVAYNASATTQLSVALGTGAAGQVVPVSVKNVTSGNVLYPAGQNYTLTAYTDHIDMTKSTTDATKLTVKASDATATVNVTDYLSLKNVLVDDIALPSNFATGADPFAANKVKVTLVEDVANTLTGRVSVNATTGAVTFTNTGAIPGGNLTGKVIINTEDVWGNKQTFTIPVVVKAE